MATATQSSTQLPAGKEYFNADDLAQILGIGPQTVRYHWRHLRERGVLSTGSALSKVEANRLLDYIAAIGRPKRRGLSAHKGLGNTMVTALRKGA